MAARLIADKELEESLKGGAGTAIILAASGQAQEVKKENFESGEIGKEAARESLGDIKNQTNDRNVASMVVETGKQIILINNETSICKDHTYTTTMNIEENLHSQLEVNTDNVGIEQKTPNLKVEVKSRKDDDYKIKISREEKNVNIPEEIVEAGRQLLGVQNVIESLSETNESRKNSNTIDKKDEDENTSIKTGGSQNASKHFSGKVSKCIEQKTKQEKKGVADKVIEAGSFSIGVSKIEANTEKNENGKEETKVLELTNKEKRGLKEKFSIYSKFGDKLSDGSFIRLGQSDRWFKQAGLLGPKGISTTDTSIAFKKVGKRSVKLNYATWNKFVDEIAASRKMNNLMIKKKLAECETPVKRRVNS